MDEKKPASLRGIYGRTSGKITAGQKKAIANLQHRYLLDSSNAQEWISDCAIVEIGFGMGEFLLASASSNSDLLHLGIDFYKPGFGTVFAQLQKHELNNVRLINANASYVLQNFSFDSCQQIHIYFPDPWPKKRHHKRRLFQPDFFQLFANKANKSTTLHFASDHADYAYQALKIMQNAPEWANKFPPDFAARAQVQRPITGFENKAIIAQRKIYDLIFIKTQ